MTPTFLRPRQGRNFSAPRAPCAPAPLPTLVSIINLLPWSPLSICRQPGCARPWQVLGSVTLSERRFWPPSARCALNEGVRCASSLACRAACLTRETTLAAADALAAAAAANSPHLRISNPIRSTCENPHPHARAFTRQSTGGGARAYGEAIGRQARHGDRRCVGSCRSCQWRRQGSSAFLFT